MKKIFTLLIGCLILSSTVFSTGGPVTTAGTITVCYGDPIDIPVTVTDFNNVGGISLTLNYDAAILQYQGVVLNSAITGSLVNGGTPGVFLLSYTCNPGINLAPNATLFTLSFSYVGLPAGGTSALTWSESQPWDNEYSTPDGTPYDKDPFGDYFINGNVIVNDCGPLTGPVTIAPLISITCPSPTIAVPVTVSNFNNVGGISLTLNYDAAILQYQGVVLNPAISGSLTNGTTTPGVFLLSFTCDPGINLAPNTTLFTLNFGYIGPPSGGNSPLTWPSNPPEANEYSDPQGTAYNKDPFGTYFINGNVTVNPCSGDGPVTTVPVITTCPSSTIAVPVTVTNFVNVGGISLTLNYSAAVLQYQGVTLNPAIVTGSNYNASVPGVFVLGYFNLTGINLNNNDILFTLYFKACATGVASLNWDPDPGANEYSGPDGIPYINTPFGTYFIDGSVNVLDVTSPSITCPADIIQANDPGLCSAQVIWMPESTVELNFGHNAMSTCQHLWQSFTATSTGVLTMVEIFPNQNNFGPWNVTIYEGEGESGCVLFNDPAFTPSGNPIIFPVPRSVGVYVVSGQRYTISIIGPCSPTDCVAYCVDLWETWNNGAVVYPGGLYWDNLSMADPVLCGAIPYPGGATDQVALHANFHIDQMVLPFTATDDCDVKYVVCSPENGSVFGIGTTPVTTTATDYGTNSATCSFNVTISETEAPFIITCPPGQSAFADVSCQTTVPDFTVTTVATDNCGPIVITQVPAAGTPVGVGVTNVTITATDGALLTATCSTTFTVQLATITGTLKYNNLANTPMNNVTLMLDPGGITCITDAFGNYSFGSLCGGTYTLSVTNNNKPVTGVNSSDAAQVNFWNAFSFPIEHVRFLSGDVTDDFNDNATDALAIQYNFVYGTPFDRTLNSGTPWVYWKAGDLILNNFDPNCTLLSIDVTVAGNQTVDLLGQVNGEFNMSFTPGGLKNASSTMGLIYGETLKLGANMEIALPVRIKNPSFLGAVSVILNFPADLAEVMDVTMQENEGRLDWAVSGNELRIGWNSLLPLELGAGETLVNIRIRTTADFSAGDEIRFTLAPDPLNELADGSFNIIPEAILETDVLEFSTTGLWNPEPGTQNSLTLESHPNPFTGYTTLTYNLPVEGHVTLRVSDMTGRKVSLPVDEYQAGGKHTVKLDALPLQPGIYTATLTLHSGNGDMMRTVKLVRNR